MTTEGLTPEPRTPPTTGPLDPSFAELPLRNLADAALTRARQLGAQHADFRFERRRSYNLRLRDGRLAGADCGSDSRLGSRVLRDGTWGFASGADFSSAGAARLAEEAMAVAEVSRPVATERIEIAGEPVYADATWISPCKINPFDVPEYDRFAVLADWSTRLLSAPAVAHVYAKFRAVQENKFYADTAGTCITQQRVRVYPQILASSRPRASQTVQTLRTLAPPTSRGWEYLMGEGFDWNAELDEMPRLLEEKVEAGPVAAGTYDLVLHPTNLWLTIHETIGHATELDRALGYETAYAGGTFVRLADIGTLRYGSELMNVTGDRTERHGLATIGYDDEGVEAQRFDIIRDGLLVGCQLDRRAAFLKELPRSNGCAYAEGAGHVPLQRMANVSMSAAPGGPTTDELVSFVEKGIYVIGDDSFSIDTSRNNFQFTGQRFYEIENGKLARPVRDVAYQGTTLELWRSLTAVGGPDTYVLSGADRCGKGQPVQIAAASHGCPSALFRAVRVLDTSKENAP